MTLKEELNTIAAESKKAYIDAKMLPGSSYWKKIQNESWSYVVDELRKQAVYPTELEPILFRTRVMLDKYDHHLNDSEFDRACNQLRHELCDRLRKEGLTADRTDTTNYSFTVYFN